MRRGRFTLRDGPTPPPQRRARADEQDDGMVRPRRRGERRTRGHRRQRRRFAVLRTLWLCAADGSAGAQARVGAAASPLERLAVQAVARTSMISEPSADRGATTPATAAAAAVRW